eukprot:SAG31_NODE_6027_length_2203_cov_1.693441_2_plen_170_part_00
MPSAVWFFLATGVVRHIIAGPSAAVVFELEYSLTDARLRRASRDARRYLYELTGEVVPLAPLPTDGTEKVLGNMSQTMQYAVLVAPVQRLPLIHPALSIVAQAPASQSVQQHEASGAHIVQRATLPEGLNLIVCSGVDEQVRGYFVVFVQLSEKYGTLIERYTARNCLH